MRRYFDGAFFGGGFFGTSTDAGSGRRRWTEAEMEEYATAMVKKRKKVETMEYGPYLDRYWKKH